MTEVFIVHLIMWMSALYHLKEYWCDT